MALTPIQPLQPAQNLTQIHPVRPARQGAGEFEKLVGRFAGELERLENQAAAEVAKLAEGKADNIHQVMIALGKSEVAFNYMLEMRNRLIEAYKEVMRMPL